jgi:malate dehydrogenase (oxaloacetate-decarboxylating)(NADP+)
MEGKGVLFKKFAGIDVFDIEIDENDPDKLVDIIAALEPTFGGINLEDIKAPECFYIERKLRERMKIPVFHDDQHGTAIVVGAAILNGLNLVGKISRRSSWSPPAPAPRRWPASTCWCMLGVPVENIWVTDIEGVVYEGASRKLMDPIKARYAKDTDARTLADVIEGADVFLGLSAGGVLKPEMVAKMAKRPLILALANPTPEILPEEVKAVRARRHHRHRPFGLSEPGQQRAVLPLHLPRRAGCRRDHHHREMKLAAVRAIAELAQAEASDVVAPGLRRRGPGLRPRVPHPQALRSAPDRQDRPGGGQAGMDSGVATRPITDFDAYRQQLNKFVYHSGSS